MEPEIMQPPTDQAGKPLTKNQHLLQWVDEMARLTKPDRIVWCDGSEEEKHRLTEEARRQGHPHPPEPAEAPRLLPPPLEPERRRARRAAHLHLHAHEGRGGPDEQLDGARRGVQEARRALRRLDEGAHDVRRPLRHGPGRLAHSKIGVELTDSIYVVLNMRIMTRMGRAGAATCSATSNDFNRGLHSTLDCNPERRFICHFPQDNTIWSVGSGLRRQRAPRQEVPRAAHRQLPRQAGGLARRAHAHPRRRVARGRDDVRRRGLPERVRQDELRHDDPAQALQGLEDLDGGRRHRVDARRRGRPALRDQPRGRVLRRRARARTPRRTRTR